MGRQLVLVLAALTLVGSACERRSPPKQYTLTGQVLAINAEYSALTIKHDDIPEQAFYMKGTIDEVLQAAEKMKAAA